jgi:D-alanine-D-alanine ligase
MKILILYNPPQGNTPDEKDVIAQRDLVQEACINLGYDVSLYALGTDLATAMDEIRGIHPDMVFNLTEAILGKDELIYIAAALLNAWKIPYTGVPLEAMFLTGNKVLAKKMMQIRGLPTAEFFSPGDTGLADPGKSYIVKPVWEEASVGIDSDSVFRGSDTQKLRELDHLSGKHYFIEEYIEGREFNISMLAAKDRVEILPIAEMLFGDYFRHKPRILGYKAKWDESSPEFRHSRRAFGTLEPGSRLEKDLNRICMDCWGLFGLRGYARIDLRVDRNERIFILEINGNPCISPDSGFVAALKQAGYSPETMIKRIIEDGE